MAGFFKRLKGLLGREEPPPPEALEEFRKTFRAKFHAFKMLLNANNTALQLMAEMETTLHGQQSFGIPSCALTPRPAASTSSPSSAP